MSRESLRTAAALVALGIADAAPLEAAEGTAEGAHHQGAHAPSVTELLFPTINFALFVVILVKYVIPAMREYLRRRVRDVTAAITESSAALADAEALMNSTRARSDSVATERESIRRDVVTSATRQGERLREQAEETGKRRLTDAALVAEQERRRAWQEVRAEVATRATELAESRLRGALSADDQREFVQQFLKEAPSR
ncbi:MAG: ATP synthase F0 subunit B [Deltaproteobacteria bacterium]|nr:ATP synthase F0 subunit B [Deltaproteobacteria bacterium]